MRFQAIHHSSVDVAHGLALLFGLGTKALPSWGFEDEVEQSFGRPRRQYDGGSKRTNDLTSSIVPRGKSFHRWVELYFLLSHLILHSSQATATSLIGRLGQALSGYPPLQRQCRSRARASLRTRHQGPSIMGFEDEVEQSFGRPCRQCDCRFKRTYELTSSIVPRGTSFHRSVELECPSIGLDAAGFSCCCCCCCCCCGLFSGPAELGAVNPYAVHDHSQPACQGHDRLFHSAAPGDLHRPGFEPGPFLRPQHALSCFVEHDPHHLISAA